MRRLRNLTFLVFLTTCAFGQTSVNSQCLDRIIYNTKHISFPKCHDSVRIINDTVLYERSSVILRDADPDAFLIFKYGLLAPSIILGASTNRENLFSENTIPFIGKLSISSFRRIRSKSQSDTVRVYSFLLWRDGFANPFMYLLQISNPNVNPINSNDDYIKGSSLRGFGFCSILL